MRQVTGTPELGPLNVLAQVAEPLGISYREDLLPGETQLTPLTHLTDALVPDAPFRRQFASLVNQLLNDAPRFSAGGDELAKNFRAWRDLPPAFHAIAAQAPTLKNSEDSVIDLGKLGTSGLEALTHLQSGNAPSAQWADNALALVNAAEKPDRSLLKFSWLPSYRALILAAANLDTLKSADPQHWRQQVMQQVAQQEPEAKYTW